VEVEHDLRKVRPEEEGGAGKEEGSSKEEEVSLVEKTDGGSIGSDARVIAADNSFRFSIGSF
jgi:hypothetical protein